MLELTIGTLILLFFLLQTKHWLVDWMWQPEYEYLNKGTYGHWGGIRHSLKNAIGTVLCFVVVLSLSWWVYLLVFLVDFLTHYHMDWFKMNYNKKKGWTPTNSENFWKLTGTDQYVHQTVYVLLVLGVLVLV